MIRSGIGFDAHRFAVGRALILGGVAIPHTAGLAGHSDADVLCHAIADALLGAMADGDIGQHFPDTDPAWQGANSLDLLRRVVARLKTRDARIGNVDAMLLAEAPRVAPHFPAMRAALAQALGVELTQVSVKATTLEGMGFIGRKEGIAAMAVATIEME